MFFSTRKCHETLCGSIYLKYFKIKFDLFILIFSKIFQSQLIHYECCYCSFESENENKFKHLRFKIRKKCRILFLNSDTTSIPVKRLFSMACVFGCGVTNASPYRMCAHPFLRAKQAKAWITIQLYIYRRCACIHPTKGHHFLLNE